MGRKNENKVENIRPLLEFSLISMSNT